MAQGSRETEAGIGRKVDGQNRRRQGESPRDRHIWGHTGRTNTGKGTDGVTRRDGERDTETDRYGQRQANRDRQCVCERGGV